MAHPTFVAVPSRYPPGQANPAVAAFDLDAAGPGQPNDLVLLFAVVRNVATDVKTPAPFVRVNHAIHAPEDTGLTVWLARRRDLVDTTPTITIGGAASQAAGACYVVRPAPGREVSLQWSTRWGSGAASSSGWTVNGITRVPGGRDNLRVILIANRPDGVPINVAPDVGWTERLDTISDWVGLHIADRTWNGPDNVTGTVWQGALSAPGRWISLQLALVDEPPGFVDTTYQPNPRWVDLRVEIDTRAQGAASKWTNPTEAQWRRIDHTNELRRLSMRLRGAADIWTMPEGSELTLELGNANGHLDPANPTSPLSPWLYREVLMRVIHAPNLLSADEMSFEQGMGSWVNHSGSRLDREYNPAMATFGRHVLAVTKTGAAGNGAVWTNPGVSVLPGALYTATAWTRAKAGNPGGSADARIAIAWRNADGTTAGDTFGPYVDNTNPVELAVAGGAPAGAAFARVYIEHAAQSVGDVHYIDDVTIAWRFQMGLWIVEAWPVRWAQGGFDATTELHLYDRVEALARARTPTSLVEWELARGVKYPKPTHMWAFREDTAAPDVRYKDAIGTADATPIGAPPKAAGETLIPYAESGGLEGSGTISSQGYARIAKDAVPIGVAGSSNMSVLAVVRVPSAAAYLAFTDGDLNNPRISLGIHAVGYASGNEPMRLSIKNNGGTVVWLNGPDGPNLADGAPHLLWWVYHTDGRLYGNYDKTSIGSVACANPEKLTSSPGSGIFTNVGAGSIGLLVAWAQTVFDNQKVAIYDDLFTPWAGDGSEARINKLLDMMAPGVPRQQGASSVGTLLPVTLAQRSPLDIIGELMVGHADRFYAWGNGTLATITGANLPAPLRTYGWGGFPVHDLEVTRQDRAAAAVRMTNDVGNEYVIGDLSAGSELSTSGGATRGEYLLGNAQRVLDYVNLAAKPGTSTIVLDPSVSGWWETLSLWTYDRVRAAYLRPWTNDLITEDREIYEVAHDFAPDRGWETVVSCRPPANW